ncbi:MAG TPA: aminoacyl-tRNA hydrolase [Firmicutes bacterium]|jgi:PTH1 family peptidyl-tRNA hydrolase|nr:aminoacyl-tRNA hydrolase [Bacillota bacterium]
MWTPNVLVAGLGNPGPQYLATRHNAGFLVLDELAECRRAAFNERGWGGLLARVSLGGKQILLLKPLTYMNRSGLSVQAALTACGLTVAELIVVHDDVDLPLGKIRVKRGGGTGGHRGLMSIASALGSDDYGRVRIGVGRPVEGVSTAAHVLEEFPVADNEVLARVLAGAAQAVCDFVILGLETAMNRHNGKDYSLPA